LLCAALKLALLVSRPLLLKTGPLPEVLALGRSTPFSRIQATYLLSAALAVALLKLGPAPARLEPPHFFSASRYLLALTPLGVLGPPPVGGPLWAPVPLVLGGLEPEGVGSVMPCFFKHALSAEKRAEPAPPPAGVTFAASELPEPELPEPPQAASHTQRSATSARAASGPRRPRAAVDRLSVEVTSLSPLWI
jgi:hypothetical protein